MKRPECVEAIKQAYRIFAYIEVLDRSKRPVRLSKVKARELILWNVLDDADLKVEWLDKEMKILAIG